MERPRGEAIGFPAYRQAGKALERGSFRYGEHRWLKIECLHMVGDSESKWLKVTALNLWEASRLSFDRPLPGKPPNIPTASPFGKSRIFTLRHSLLGERDG